MKNMLLQIRSDEKKAVYRRIEAWKKGAKMPNAALQLQDMVEGAIADRDKDERFLHYILQRARGNDKQLIVGLNQFIQDYCERSILLHGLIRDAIRALSKTGHPTGRVEELDKATRDYESWMEDYPDLLIMNYEPVEKLIKDEARRMLNGSKKTPKLSKAGRQPH